MGKAVDCTCGSDLLTWVQCSDGICIRCKACGHEGPHKATHVQAGDAWNHKNDGRLHYADRHTATKHGTVNH